MKASQMILSALVGWIAGMVSLLVWSFLWPQIMPMAGRASALPGYWKMLLVLMLVMTPFGARRRSDRRQSWPEKAAGAGNSSMPRSLAR